MTARFLEIALDAMDAGRIKPALIPCKRRFALEQIKEDSKCYFETKGFT